MNEMMEIAIINCILTIAHFSQIFKYMRVIEQFGKIIDLSMTVISKVMYFQVFYLLWIIVLGIMYGMLGQTLDKDDDHPNDGEEYV